LGLIPNIDVIDVRHQLSAELKWDAKTTGVWQCMYEVHFDDNLRQIYRIGLDSEYKVT